MIYINLYTFQKQKAECQKLKAPLTFLKLDRQKYINKIAMGGFEQRPWTPTKRRGPIAAEHSSPGPACVQLPNLIGIYDA